MLLYLLDYFLIEYNNKYNLNRQLSNGLVQILLEHEWKGNVRELSHLIERLVVTVDSLVIDVNHLPSNIFNIVDSFNEKTDETFDDKVDDYITYLLQKSYDKHKTSRKIAQELEISQTRAHKLIKKYLK